jgi:hypothetical protein
MYVLIIPSLLKISALTSLIKVTPDEGIEQWLIHFLIELDITARAIATGAYK